MENYTCLTYNVEKIGDITSYVGAMVINRNDASFPIGVVADAEELSDSYSLTIKIWNKIDITETQDGMKFRIY